MRRRPVKDGSSSAGGLLPIRAGISRTSARFQQRSSFLLPLWAIWSGAEGVRSRSARPVPTSALPMWRSQAQRATSISSSSAVWIPAAYVGSRRATEDAALATPDTLAALSAYRRFSAYPEAVRKEAVKLAQARALAATASEQEAAWIRSDINDVAVALDKGNPFETAPRSCSEDQADGASFACVSLWAESAASASSAVPDTFG